MRSGLQQVAVPCPKKKWIRRIWNTLCLNTFLDLGVASFHFKLHVQEWSRDMRTWIGLEIQPNVKNWGIYLSLNRPYAPWTDGSAWRHWPHLECLLNFSRHVLVEIKDLSVCREVKGERYTGCVYTVVELRLRFFGKHWVRELYSPDKPKNVCFAS